MFSHMTTTFEQLTAEQLTAEQLTAEQLTAEQLTAEQLRTLDAEVAVTIMGFGWWIRETAGLGVEVFAPPSYVAEALRRGNTMTRMTEAEAPPLAALPSFSDFSRVPRYSADIAAAWEMEEEVQRQGLGTEYGMELMALVVTPETETGRKPFTFVFDTAHASPKMRCRAALSCVRAAKGKTQCPAT